MKKTLMVAALTGVFASAAHAQSSVTLYGLIDAGITYTNNQQGHSNWQMTSGQINGSRFGLRGSEDLGGGLKAIFTLENGFGINDGTLKQGGRLFGRQAFVGLSSNDFGSVTLGRQYDSMVDYVGPLALTGTQYGGTQFAHPFDNDNLNNSFRLNNSVKYTSPLFAGLRAGAVYSFSNDTNFATNRAYSFGASYNYGPLKAGAAYMQLNGTQSGTSAATAGALDQAESGAVGQDKTLFGATGFQLGASTQRVFGGGATYAFGPAIIGFVYTQSQFFDAINSRASTYKFNNYEVNAKYNLTPALSLAANYTYTDGSMTNPGTAATDPKWSQINLQTDYALSKRTDIYLEGLYQHAIGAGNNAYISGAGGTSSTANQIVVVSGIRTRF